MALQTVETEMDVPLVVDLDGTLIKTDLLFEAILIGIKANPLFIFSLIVWLFGGIANLKDKLANHVQINASLLPYNMELLSFLKDEFSRGRTLVLATASHFNYAHAVANHLGIFSSVLSSSNTVNLKGRQKSSLLVSKYGEKGFDYIGDSKADLSIFPKAKDVFLVRPSRKLHKKSSLNKNIKKIFNDKINKTLLYLKAIRIHQWTKNILIFIPLLTSHNWLNFSMLFKCIGGFLAMSICASGTYILNDLFDLNSDRMHPRKRSRPFAAGEISILKGILISVVFIVLGLTISFLLNIVYGLVLISYLVITLAYSFSLKKVVLIDTILLASLYTIRVIAGAKIINVELSFWLLAFSIFIFYSLALLKRVTELNTMAKLGKEDAKGRGYTTKDLQTLQQTGITSGLLSIIVFALYINSDVVRSLYSKPQILWLICPLILYWINRLWLKTSRDEMHDDPIVFTIKDMISQVVFLMVCILLIIASYI